MFKILYKNLTIAMNQIEKIESIEERKSKAVELHIPKNLNRMKSVDEPAYDELMARYKKAVGA